MSNNNSEKYCSMCGRPESIAGRLFQLGGNLGICMDCLQKTTESFMGGYPFASGVPTDGVNFAKPDNLDKEEGNDELDFSEIDEADFDDADDFEVSKDDEDDEPDKKSSEKKSSKDNGDDGRKQYGPFSPFGFPNVQVMNFSDLQNLMRPGTQVKAKKKKKNEDIKPLINLSDVPRPHKIKEMLDEYVVGQEHAKKVISVAVYNHYKRIFSEKEMEESGREKGDEYVEIEKSNMLMIGPTGCGKTYLVKTLAKLLNVPLAITDATSLTEAGYIGDDIESVVSKLLAEADNDVERAEQGIVFIDEIDKIAKKKNAHARDVSGESVQQGMLKLLEGADIEVPVGASSKNAMVPLATVNTRNILFICGGAFPDLEDIVKKRLTKSSSIGYGASLKDAFDKEKNILAKTTPEDLREFGMIPEFIGRLPIIYSLEGLTDEMMVRILKEPRNAIIKQYQKLLLMDEVKLQITDEALLEIAKKAQERETGARALRAIIEELMLDIMYEIPKDDNIGTVTITEDYIKGTGGPQIEMRG